MPSFFYCSSISTLLQLPHIIARNPQLKGLIDSGALNSIINPEITYKLFSNTVFLLDSKIISVYKITQGTYTISFPILYEFGEDIHFTSLNAPLQQKYDCLSKHKDLLRFKANINYETQIFSIPKFEIEYLKDIPTRQKSVNLICYMKVKSLLLADQKNKVEKIKIGNLCHLNSNCFHDEGKG